MTGDIFVFVFVGKTFANKQQNRMQIQFQGFLFPQVVQKHKIGEVGK